MTLKASLRGYLADIKQAFDRAPVECVLTVGAAVMLSYMNEHKDASVEVMHAVIASVLTFAFAWGATLVEGLGAVSRTQRWAITLVGLGVGVAYLLLIHNMDLEAEGWRAFMLLSGFALLLLALPAWIRDREDPSLRLRRINGRIALRTITIGLYGLALFAGLALAIMSVDKLFELNLNERLYGHVYIWIMVVLVPWVIVGGLNEYVRPVSEPTELVRVIRRFNPALLFPQLAAIYYVILCAYAVRIAITGELPQNLVSPLVIAAGALAALALVVFDPDHDSDWSMRWLRFTPVVFMPLGALGIWALTARVSDYGWTEFRLLRMTALLVLMALAALATVQLIRRRRFALRFLPLAPGALLVLGAIGPWGVPAIARRDQQHRLALALERAHVDVRQLPPAADTTHRIIAASLYDQINSTGNYLVQHFGEKALTAVIPRNPPRGVAEFYHLAPGARKHQPEGFWSSRLPAGQGVRLSNGDVVYRVQFPGKNQQAPRRDTLFIAVSGDTVTAPLAQLIRATVEGASRGMILDSTLALLHPVTRTGRSTDLLVLDADVRVQNRQYSLQRLSAILTVHNQ